MSQTRSPRQRPSRFWQRVSAAGWLLIGLALGLAGSLYYAWVINPVIYTDASPARLSQRYQAEYIRLVSQSYAADGDWPRAEQRLNRLDDPALADSVSALLENDVRAQADPEALRHLAALAQQVGSQGQALSLLAPTQPAAELLPTPTSVVPATAVPTRDATATNTAVPSATPAPTQPATATPQPNYRLLDQERLCAADGDSSRIEVITLDAFLNEMGGVEVLVNWQGGSDRFYTGFKPALGPGYGDFDMAPETSYTVVLADGSPAVSGLRSELCDSGFNGGWRLTFQNLRTGSTPTPEPDE